LTTNLSQMNTQAHMNLYPHIENPDWHVRSVQVLMRIEITQEKNCRAMKAEMRKICTWLFQQNVMQRI